ncbi:MAG TPA: hypothetical protein VGR27_02270 [Longimicrobiaceae bacterium]|nr:hypothetical protein [Longimicrobiaceae bacterium]
MTDPRPVLYLDLDDTLLTYASGKPQAAPGAREFLLWALESFEVRWLTTWCPSGEMQEKLLGDLCKMLKIETAAMENIRGFDWEYSASKVDGIAWLEHLVLDRPFLWIEDQYGVGEFELEFLDEHGFRPSYHHCNVTEDPQALLRLLELLQTEKLQANAA